ncbi:MAG: hypothetical protein IKR76_02550, partial [Ruminococcus sp.]|nr:hypothetical protein [Ruminococcus sp.]
MDENKNNKNGKEMPDIDFKKREELSSTLQFKVADAIKNAKENKEEMLESQRESAEQEHYVIKVDEKPKERVKSTDLLGEDSTPKKAPAVKPAPPARDERPRQQSSQRAAQTAEKPRRKKKKSTAKVVLIILGII